MTRPRGTPTLADYATPMPVTLRPGRSIADARRLMRERRIRHLPVLDGGKIVGIVSERDLLLISTVRGVDAETMPVEEAMTADPVCFPRDTPVLTAVTAMRKRKLGSVVVEERGRAVAVFTTTDALSVLIDLL